MSSKTAKTAAMLVRITVAALLVACSKSPDSTTVPPSPTARPPAIDHVNVIPDTLISKLGPAEIVFGLDLARFNAKPLIARIPEPLACARAVLSTVGTIVIATGQETVAFVTGAPAPATIACAKSIGEAMHIRVTEIANGFEVAASDPPIDVQWHDDVATITRHDHPLPTGTPDSTIMSLLATAPADAGGVFADRHDPKHVMKTMAAWLQPRGDVFVATIVVEGYAEGGAHKALSDMISGFKEGAAENHIVLDASWFQIHDQACRRRSSPPSRGTSGFHLGPPGSGGALTRSSRGPRPLRAEWCVASPEPENGRSSNCAKSPTRRPEPAQGICAKAGGSRTRRSRTRGAVAILQCRSAS